jgi:hypothetical protein
MSSREKLTLFEVNWWELKQVRPIKAHYNDDCTFRCELECGLKCEIENRQRRKENEKMR